MPNRPPRYSPHPKRPPPSHAARGTTTERGYGWKWRQLRLTILAAEPLCRSCKARGLIVAATEVDHIIPKCQGGTDDTNNLAPLCSACNAAKSAKDKAGKQRHSNGG